MIRDHHKGLHTIALFEAAKGALVLFVGVGLPSLLHKRAHRLVLRLVDEWDLNPTIGYPHVFLDLAEKFDNAKLWLLATAAIAYATLRFAEAYGLWRQRAWAEWLALVSAALYVPFELYEIAKHATWFRIAIFVVNVVIVIYLAKVLAERRNTRPA